MNKINEIKLPKGVDSISVTQHDDKIVIEFIPKEPKFKEGDFVYQDGRIMIVKSYPNMYHANARPIYSDMISYNGAYVANFSEPTFRYATAVEKQRMIDALAKKGKRWDADKLKIEDILKKGDLAIFWDSGRLNPAILLYHGKSHSGDGHYDNFGTYWDNAVKWDGTKEQFEKILRGEIN